MIFTGVDKIEKVKPDNDLTLNIHFPRQPQYFVTLTPFLNINSSYSPSADVGERLEGVNELNNVSKWTIYKLSLPRFGNESSYKTFDLHETQVQHIFYKNSLVSAYDICRIRLVNITQVSLNSAQVSLCPVSFR